MRTTLTLEDDLAARLRVEAARSGVSFKQAVNQILRTGLEARSQKKPAKKFKVRAFDTGIRPGISFDCASRLLDEIEGPMHR